MECKPQWQMATHLWELKKKKQKSGNIKRLGKSLDMLHLYIAGKNIKFLKNFF